MKAVFGGIRSYVNVLGYMKCTGKIISYDNNGWKFKYTTIINVLKLVKTVQKYSILITVWKNYIIKIQIYYNGLEIIETGYKLLYKI